MFYMSVTVHRGECVLERALNSAMLGVSVVGAGVKKCAPGHRVEFRVSGSERH